MDWEICLWSDWPLFCYVSFLNRFCFIMSRFWTSSGGHCCRRRDPLQGLHIDATTCALWWKKWTNSYPMPQEGLEGWKGWWKWALAFLEASPPSIRPGPQQLLVWSCPTIHRIPWILESEWTYFCTPQRQLFWIARDDSSRPRWS